MRLEKASYQASKYACLHFHYAHAVPQTRLGYSVFNAENEWCGVILFSNGANQFIASSFNMVQGQVMELVRVALNGKQECTSQALAMALRLLKKDAPAVKVIVSYADRNQGHIGTIYQATNWHYLGEFAAERGIMLKGKLTHRRSINSKYRTSNIEWLRIHIDPNAEVISGKTKIKYAFPLDKHCLKLIKSMSKPYPKKNKSMAAPAGNKFWMLRSKHGRDKLFTTPDLLWEAACEYFQWCDENPWLSKKAIQKTVPVKKKKGKKIETTTEQQIQQEVSPASRPYSLTGFCIYVGASSKWWNNFRAECNNKNEEDFLEVIARVEETIETQQFEGAAVGAFNANIIARKLGLADKQEVDHTTAGKEFKGFNFLPYTQEAENLK